MNITITKKDVYNICNQTLSIEPVQSDLMIISKFELKEKKRKEHNHMIEPAPYR